MAERIAGTVFFKVDGQQYSVSGSVNVDLETTEKEGVVGINGPEGYKEMGKMPFIEGTFFATANFPYATIRNKTSATVTAELANGKVATLYDAVMVGPLTVNADDGTIPLRWEGQGGRWL